MGCWRDVLADALAERGSAKGLTGLPEQNKALETYKKRLLEHREWEAKVRNLRMGMRDLNKEYDRTEDDLKALQSVGQIIGELLRQLDDERYIVKASSGPRYVVGCRNKVRQRERRHAEVQDMWRGLTSAMGHGSHLACHDSVRERAAAPP